MSCEYRANAMMRRNAVWVFITCFLVATNSLSQSSTSPQAAAPGFVIDSTVSTQAEELRRDVEGLNDVKCDGHSIYLESPTTIGAFMGFPAKFVRVTRYAQTIESPAGTKPRQILEKVWGGRFRSASCQIAWAEFTSWSIEAVVEFQDGKRGRLITDGFHVALQDHAGKIWFIRLNG
jgi:hypothetical protein